MKKIYSLFVALVACAMLFVACEPSGVSNKDKMKATQLTASYDAYYSHEYIEGVSNDYWMSFGTEDIVMDMSTGYPMGTGEFVYLEVFPTTVENNFPAGSFTLAEEARDGYAWAGWEWDLGVDLGYDEGYYVIPQGCFVYVLEDDELVTTKYMVSGYVEVTGTPSAAEVYADVTFDDGTKSTYYYKGRLKFEDYDEGDEDNPDNGTGDLNWDYEPTTAGEYSATFEYCDMNNWGDYYGDGTEYVDMTLTGTEWYAIFGLCAPLGSGVDAYGTYTVKDGYTDWTAVPSPGGDNDYDYASFVATDMDASGKYSTAYYIASGTVVVAEDGVKFDVVSHYGSKIQGEYKGTVTIADKSTPQYAPAMSGNGRVRSIKLERASVADMVYFGELKNRVRK